MPARPRKCLLQRRAAPAPSSAPDRKPLGLSWSLLPYADFIAGGIAQRRDPEIAFRIRRLDENAARSLHFLEQPITTHHTPTADHSSPTRWACPSALPAPASTARGTWR